MTTEDIKLAVKRFETKQGYRPHGLKAALIDMDGTLFDSMPWHARAWHRMVTELGIKADVNEFFNYEGMTGKATINLLFRRAFGRDATDEEVVELYGRKSKYFQENNNARVMPGARKMVKTLQSAGVTPVLVTGSGQATLLDRLNEEFDGAFPADKRITSHDVSVGKPSPEPYLRGLEKAGCSDSEAIVVENAPLGVESGVAAGVFTLAVRTGPVDVDRLVDAGADLVFNSMEQFAETLPKLLFIINE